MSRNKTCGMWLAIALGAFAVGAQAQDAEPAAKGDNAFADIGGRWYVSPMVSWTGADNDREVDDGDGYALAIGKNVNRYFNFELAGWQTKYDAKNGGGTDGKIQALELVAYGFPWAQSPSFAGGLYGLAGLGWGTGKQFSDRPGLYDQNKDRAVFDVGAGLLMRLPFIRFASLRFDARYRIDFTRRPFAQVDEDEDNDHPTFQEPVLSVGLLIPIGSVHEEPPPAAVPVAVVAPAPVCSDTQDNDGDGKTDFPADPGCTAADDSDETDPPPPPPPPCKTPAPGERVSLAGCGMGDTIVLRGVNFDFDKSNLTVNAKTILDNVAEELTAYPEIKVEVGGHTDAKGSDEYNQKLSDRRAASVVQYLIGKGVAAERMSSAGYGETKPVADNETDEGRELNRRVELKITAGVAGASPATPVAEGTAATPSP